MSDLTGQILNHLDPSSIEAIAAKLGVDPAQAQAAIEQAVPLVVGGLAKNASTAAGADALHNAVADHAGMDIGSVLGSVLGGGGGGGSILGHIFGTQQGQAAHNLGQASGLGTQNAGQLMAMLAPIIMSVLANRTQSQGLGAGGLGGMLGQELRNLGQSGHGGLLTSVLDQDGDGQLGLGDLLKVGSSFFGSRGKT